MGHIRIPKCLKQNKLDWKSLRIVASNIIDNFQNCIAIGHCESGWYWIIRIGNVLWIPGSQQFRRVSRWLYHSWIRFEKSLEIMLWENDWQSIIKKT